MSMPHLGITLILVLSIVLQVTAAVLAVRLIRVSGRATAWTWIAMGLMLMAVRRMVPILHIAFADPSYVPDYANEIIGLILSLAMVVGISRIAPIFRAWSRNELQLREAALEIQDLYDRAPCGYHSLDKDGTFVRMNDTELEWLGYAREEIIGTMRFPDVLTEESRKTFAENFPKFLATGRVKDLEFDLVRKDQSIMPVLVSATAIRNERGEFVMSRSTLYDISERRRMERILTAQVRLTEFSANHSVDELLAETLEELVGLTGVPVGCYHFVDPGQQSIVLQNWYVHGSRDGVTAGEKGTVCPVANHRGWADCVRSRIPVLHNDRVSLMNSLPAPGGGVPLVREAVVPITRGTEVKAIIGLGDKDRAFTEDDIQAVLHLGDFSWDIVERKRAEEALRESERRVRRTLKAILSPNGEVGAMELVDVLDSEKLQSLMDKFYTLTHIAFGITDLHGNLLVGTGWQEICSRFHRVNPESRRNCVESDLELTRDVTRGTFKQYRCKNCMWEMSTPIMLGDTHAGNIFLGQFLVEGEEPDYDAFREQARRYGFDETDYLAALDKVPRLSQHTLDAAMAFYTSLAEVIGSLSYSNLRLTRTLEARRRADEEVRALNQELEQRVADRTALLEATNQELEAFAYSVSHDLRAPVRHIDGFLGLLEAQTAGSLDEQSAHYMEAIAASAKRMGTLIDDLLSFSRMGRAEIVKVQTDLSALVREVIDDFSPEADGRKVRWHIGVLPVVRGDRNLLRAVLSNLLSNALKFTRPREIAEIEIGSESAASETVVFVRDNGVGFDPQYGQKLFGTFQRLHRADEFPGTGIGLANVRRIINRHGGRTWATGEPDHGATFYFSLPVRDVAGP